LGGTYRSFFGFGSILGIEGSVVSGFIDQSKAPFSAFF